MNLAARKDIETVRLQLSKVEPKDAIIPIFSGNDSRIEDFKSKYLLMASSQHKVKYFPNIDASVVTAIFPKKNFKK